MRPDGPSAGLPESRCSCVSTRGPRPPRRPGVTLRGGPGLLALEGSGGHGEEAAGRLTVNSGFCPDSSKPGLVRLQLPPQTLSARTQASARGLTARTWVCPLSTAEAAPAGARSALTTCRTPELRSGRGWFLPSGRAASDAEVGGGTACQAPRGTGRVGSASSGKEACGGRAHSAAPALLSGQCPGAPRQAPFGGRGFSVAAGNPQAFVGEEETSWGRMGGWIQVGLTVAAIEA